MTILNNSLCHSFQLVEAVMLIRAGFFRFGFDLTAKHRIRIRIQIRQ
jgi:hypothetical protein